jgi:3-phenylpropionate/cinnamic acid dioxygenase small subunit
VTDTDRESIARALAEYCRSCDDGRFEALGELFESDAALVIAGEVTRGRAAIIEAIASRQPPERRGRHMTTNVVVTVDGTTASAESDYVFFTFSTTGSLVPSVAGRYVDGLVRSGDGGWRFTSREIVMLRHAADIHAGAPQGEAPQ